MPNIFLTVFLLFMTVPAWQPTGLFSQSSGVESSRVLLEGDWRGPSTCLVKPSACHDEDALYQITKVEDVHYKLMANKIVDGKPEEMGEADCHFDPSAQLLHCGFEKVYLDLKLTADRLEGAMFLIDKTRWRDIRLHKQPAKPKS